MGAAATGQDLNELVLISAPPAFTCLVQSISVLLGELVVGSVALVSASLMVD